MSDPSSRFRSLILFGSHFDMAAVRVLCLQVTVRMPNQHGAARLREELVARMEEVELAIGMEQPDTIIRSWRQDAYDALAAMEKAAYR